MVRLLSLFMIPSILVGLLDVSAADTHFQLMADGVGIRTNDSWYEIFREPNFQAQKRYINSDTSVSINLGSAVLGPIRFEEFVQLGVLGAKGMDAVFGKIANGEKIPKDKLIAYAKQALGAEYVDRAMVASAQGQFTLKDVEYLTVDGRKAALVTMAVNPELEIIGGWISRVFTIQGYSTGEFIWVSVLHKPSLTEDWFRDLVRNIKVLDTRIDIDLGAYKLRLPRGAVPVEQKEIENGVEIQTKFPMQLDKYFSFKIRATREPAGPNGGGKADMELGVKMLWEYLKQNLSKPRLVQKKISSRGDMTLGQLQIAHVVKLDEVTLPSKMDLYLATAKGRDQAMQFIFNTPKMMDEHMQPFIKDMMDSLRVE